MPDSRYNQSIILILSFLLLWTLFPMGCAQWRSALGDITARNETVAVTPTATDAAPTATAVPTPAVITLTVWTSEEFAPTRGDEAGAIMELRYETFMETYSDVIIEHRLKKPYGKGGLLDFLITSSAVVPQMLPDVVILDIAELNHATERGVLSPLDDLISTELSDNLYPWARDAGTVEGQWVGIPFAVELEHLVYSTEQIEEPPLTWQEVLTREIPYIFPAGGDGSLVNAAFLLQYWALGGELLDDIGNPNLDLAKVEEILEFYREGYERDIFKPAPFEFHHSDECWEAYTQMDVALAHISSRRFLTERATDRDIGFGFIPTKDELATDAKPLAVGRGWAVVITTKDSRRLPIAVEFVEHIFSANTLGRWTCATHYLPSRRDALTCYESDDEYVQFIQTLLENARFRPYSAGYHKVATALQTAVGAVLQEGQTPTQAIEGLKELSQQE